MEKILNKIKHLGVFVSGITAHHYGSKLLDRKEYLAEEKAQSIKDRIDQVVENLKASWENILLKCDKIKDPNLSEDKNNLLLKLKKTKLLLV